MPIFRSTNCINTASGIVTVFRWLFSIVESEREGTRAETRIGLSAKRTSPFKSAGRQFSRLLAVEECGWRMQDYWLPTPFASFPFTSPPVRHRVPFHSDSRLQLPTSCSQTAVSNPLCFRTYLKAPEWHSAYQNAGKSPPPAAALCLRTPSPTNARRVAFQKKGSF